MKGRPEVLFPLFAEISVLDGIGPKIAQALAKAEIESPRDVLFTLPYSGMDRRLKPSIRGLTLPADATVEVTIRRHVTSRRKGGPVKVQVEDAETTFNLVFFHGGDWVLRQLPIGARKVVSGRVEPFDGEAEMAHPEHILDPGDAEGLPDFEPIYSRIQDVSPKTVRRAAASALSRAPELSEWIDPELLAREGWPTWRQALMSAHAPESAADMATNQPARQRLAYDELFAHQMTLALARSASRKKPGIATRGDGRLRDRVLASLPYQPTGAQIRACTEIDADMASGARMNRLLQGDVGSGKTLVALLALLQAVEAGGQGVLMAPTEILARQHLESLRPLAEQAEVVLEALTGRDKGRERDAKLAALASGDIQILVGTHAVFQKDVTFHDLRIAVIDEQHRFGVAQRMELGAKGSAVDVLVMTATPIPRSLSLAQYGHMDVSVLDEKPPGRKPVTTALVSTGRLDEVVEHLRRATAEGRQAYWVCPLVGESETVDLTAAEDRYTRLRAVLGEETVGLVHGQLPPAEKDAAMTRFVSGESRVLVATTAIEVGVNVPNATIMVIERAETFGLAQLHQLRGRVGRGSAASTCLLIYQPPLTDTGQRRLEILRQTEDGFRISEEDLAMRGAGDVIGTAQSGLPRFRIADLERQSGLMAMAQADARRLLEVDPGLESPRGAAARVLLWLMEQDKAIRLLDVG